MRSLSVALALILVAAPAFAQEAPEPGHHAEAAPAQGHGDKAKAAGHGDAHAAGPVECKDILAQHVGHAVSTDVAGTIFHHVSDSYVLAFESPISHDSISVDFKRLQCQLTGWNGIFHIGPVKVDLTPTKHAFWMWVAAALLILMFWFAAPKKGQMVPHGLAAMLEMVVVFVRDDIARKNIGQKEGDRYTPYLLNVFFFIFMMNALGLIPYCASATANIGVTLALALMTFFLTQAAGIRAAGFGGYLKHLTAGVHPALWPIMIPVEFLGLFTKPFALTIRLFANMVAGHIVIYFLIALIFILQTAWLALVSVPFAFGIYLLEIFVALVQAYVFTMLSALFIGFGVAMGHHEAHDAHGENAGHGAHH